MHRLDPERASAGDRVLVSGEGFPEGRPATVTFRGDLLRPGLPKQTDVRISAQAVPAERGTVAIAFDRGMERRFVGAAGSAVHTTFIGDVQVTFQPGPDGSMPLFGAAHGVRFDVLPSAGQAEGAAEAPEHSAVEFLGFSATPAPSGRGLAVDAVDPDGRAFAAGIRRGDLIVEIDGLSVLTESDMTVRGGQRAAHVVVERSGRPLPPLTLDVEGLAPLGVADVIGPASLVLLSCLLLALQRTRAGVVLRWLGRLAEPRRAAEELRGRSAAATLSALLPPEGNGRELVAPALLPLIAVSAAFGWLAVGRALLRPDSDLLAMAIGTAIALVLVRGADGAARSRKVPVKAFILSAGRALVCALPALGAVLGAVVASGRFVVAEIVADQGGAPWRWASMRNPGLLVLSVLLLASAVPDVGMTAADPPIEGLPRRPVPRPSGMRAVLRAVESAYLWTVCGLSVVLFFGGWRVPGIASVVQEGSRPLIALGFGFFLVKLWVIALVLGAIRRGAGRIALSHVAPLALRVGLPASLFALVLATAWTAAQDGLRSSVGADFLGYVAVMLVAALATYIGAAALRGRRHAVQAASVNPWL
ncbi:MAG TPA: NADH-quinone oxidoreductase subunit H [Polyangiaceae bacterium]|nr:NADH-quinone oxidoreductase subunit H [Polyangiaceae bacterium]